jgi:hypothetical protein
MSGSVRLIGRQPIASALYESPGPDDRQPQPRRLFRVKSRSVRITDGLYRCLAGPYLIADLLKSGVGGPVPPALTHIKSPAVRSPTIEGQRGRLCRRVRTERRSIHGRPRPARPVVPGSLRTVSLCGGVQPNENIDTYIDRRNRQCPISWRAERDWCLRSVP